MSDQVAGKLYPIDSRQRNPGSTSSTDFTIAVNLGDVNPVEQYRVIGAFVPNTRSVVTSARNEIHIIEDTAGTPAGTTVTIPSGIYNPQSLAEQISDALTTGSTKGQTYAVTVNGDTFRFIISNTTSGALPFSIDQSLATTPILREIGFDADNLYASEADSIVAPFVYQFIDPELYVQCPELGTNFAASFPYTFPIRFDVSSGAVALQAPQNFFDRKLDIPSAPISLTTLTVKLVDIDGVVVDLNGADIRFTLELF